MLSKQKRDEVVKIEIVLFVICMVLSFGIAIIANKVGYENKIIRVDGLGYYSYLPNLFTEFYIGADSLNCGYAVLDNGIAMNKYPVGVAVCQAPFFLVVLFICKIICKLEVTGWELPFQIAVLISSSFYYALGTLFNYKTFSKFYKKKNVLLSLFFVSLGTRLFYYASIDACLSHAYSYSMFSVLVYYAFKFEAEKLTYKDVVVCGIASGLLINIRNTNIIMLLFLAICIIFNILKYKYKIIKVMSLFLLYLSTIVIISIPQLVYWHSISGHWIVYSYEGEGFSWSTPHIFETLIGIDSITGVLRGAPILFFGFLIGLFYIFKYHKLHQIFAANICMIFNLYIMSTWWCYYSLSRRAYVEYIPLIIPFFCSIFESVKGKRRDIYIMFCTLCTLYSVYKMMQYFLYWI